MTKKESFFDNIYCIADLTTLQFQIDNLIINYPDYPKPGIQFKDIWPLFSDPKVMNKCTELLIQMAEPFDVIVGIESRGFYLGALISHFTGKLFVPVRKKGKLPGECLECSYDLEYGSATLEIQKNCGIKPGMKVMVHDDVLATGGTALAAGKLVEMLGGVVSNYCFVSTIEVCNGYDKLDVDKVIELIRY